MLAAGISIHNIVQDNRDILLSKSLSINLFPNKPKLTSSYGPVLGIYTPPFLLIGVFQGGQVENIFW